MGNAGALPGATWGSAGALFSAFTGGNRAKVAANGKQTRHVKRRRLTVPEATMNSQKVGEHRQKDYKP